MSAGELQRVRVQVRLADLFGWVAGAGLVAMLYRGARARGRLEVHCTLGLGAGALAIFLALALVRQVLARGRARGRRADESTRVAVAWRLGLIAVLAAFVAEEADVLGEGPATSWLTHRTVRRQILPVVATLGMAGLIAGVSPGPRRPRAPRKVAWLSVVWAAIAGVAIVATQVFIPHLVLLALEAVSNAMTRPVLPPRPTPSLHVRLAHAGLEAVPVLISCLILGLVLARELRRPRPTDGELGGTPPVLLLIWLTTLASAAGAAWLGFRAIPTIHQSLADGLARALDLKVASAIVLGFAGLAAGLAARAADRPMPEPEPEVEARGSARPALGLLFKTFAVLVLINVIIDQLLHGAPSPQRTPGGRAGWLGATLDWLRAELLPSIFRGPFEEAWEPVSLFIALTQLWLAWRVVVLLVTPVSIDLTPIDASLSDRPTLSRFATRWLALTVLMLASMPALLVAGLALLDFVYFRLG